MFIIKTFAAFVCLQVTIAGKKNCKHLDRITLHTPTDFIPFTSVEDMKERGISTGCDRSQKIYIGKRNSEPGPIYLNENGPRYYWSHKGSSFFTENMTKVEFLKLDCVCDYDWFSSERAETIENSLLVYHGFPVYYGRVFHDNKLHVGKISSRSKSIHYPDEGKEKTFAFYDVLVCSPKNCVDTRIDLSSKKSEESQHKISKCEVYGEGDSVFCRNFTTLNKVCEITTDRSIEKIRKVIDLLSTDTVSPKYLIFRQQVVTFLPINIHEAFPILRSFEVSKSGLLNIAQRFFKGLQDLELLNLTGNLIDEVESGCFTDLQHLTILDLSHNRIQSVKTKSFEGLNELESLYLNDNRVKELSTDFLTIFKNLKFLDFSSNNCSITNFPNKSLKQIENEIITTCPAPFELNCVFSNKSTICRATKLVFKHESIKMQAANSQEIVKFIVDRQLLKFIPSRLAEIFPKLQRILILSSQLSSLTTNSFKNLFSLTCIEILGNDLKNINADTFDAVPQLEFLDLSSNHIRSLPQQIFVRLALLTELRLSHNEIKVLDTNVLPPKNSIKVFHINSNELERISPDELDCLRQSSEEVDFRSNRCVNKKLPKSKDPEVRSKKFAELVDVISHSCK